MRPAGYLVILPILVAAVLALPTFSFPFLWDDFDFLGRTVSLEATELLPDSQIMYYRPISRELFFSVIHLLGGSPRVGHILNLFALLGVVYLLYRCSRLITGDQAALYAALLFSAMGALPVLVGWISGCQDLLAIVLVLGALLAELQKRRGIALALALGALLSKETALAMIPALVAAATVGASRADRRLSILRYSVLVLSYLSLHPAVRAFVSDRPDSTGMTLPSTQLAIRSIASGLLATFNILPQRPSAIEWAPLWLSGIVGILLTALVWLSISRSRPTTDQGLDPAHQLLLTLLSSIPPILMVAFLAPMWSPYYACFPALGVCMAGGTLIARLPRGFALSLLMAYLVCGLWLRTVGLEPTVVTEANLRRTGLALGRVEAEFKRLRNSFPPQSTVYVSTQLGGPAGIYTHMYRFQALRIWYREPSLLVLDPNRYHPGALNEFLFWLTPKLDLVEIDLRTLLPRTTGDQPQAFAYYKTLRTFALGRAAGGKVDSAVRILTLMPGREPIVEAYDRRTAAAILLASNRRPEADSLLAGVPTFPWEEAMEATFAVLHEPARGLDLDAAVMEAFGLNPSDITTNRLLMRAFNENGFSESAIRFAHRVALLAPNDPEALTVSRKWSRKVGPHLTEPVPQN